MDKYSLSQNLFSKIDGINNEKILGIKLLKSEHLSGREQIVCIKDVADTALMMCGFFSNSLEKRIVSEQYYYDPTTPGICCKHQRHGWNQNPYLK